MSIRRYIFILLIKNKNYKMFQKYNMSRPKTHTKHEPSQNMNHFFDQLHLNKDITSDIKFM